MPVILHGPSYSTYTRTVRMALAEKGVAYTLNEVDVLRGAGGTPEHLARHPWGKVPAFEHDGFLLYETFATSRYVDEAFAGPSLQPADPKLRARMTQICGIVDSYAYRPMLWKFFVPSVIVPMQGGRTDAALVAEGLAEAEKALAAIEELASGDLLCGGQVTLADLHLLPSVEFLRMVPSGAEAFARLPRLVAWWDRMNARETVVRTRPKLG